MRKLIFGMTIVSLGLGALYASSVPIREIPGSKGCYSQSATQSRAAKKKSRKKTPIRQIPGTNSAIMETRAPNTVAIAPVPLRQCKKQVQREIPGSKRSVLNASSICIVPAPLRQYQEQVQREIPGSKRSVVTASSIGIAPTPIRQCKEQVQREIPGSRRSVATASSIGIAPVPCMPTAQIIVPEAQIGSSTFASNYMLRASATLTPINLFEKQKVLELSDGSLWRIRHRHCHMVRNWSRGDIIVIRVKKHSSTPKYDLINHSRGEIAKVKFPIARDLDFRLF